MHRVALILSVSDILLACGDCESTRGPSRRGSTFRNIALASCLVDELDALIASQLSWSTTPFALTIPCRRACSSDGKSQDYSGDTLCAYELQVRYLLPAFITTWSRRFFGHSTPMRVQVICVDRCRSCFSSLFRDLRKTDMKGWRKDLRDGLRRQWSPIRKRQAQTRHSPRRPS